MIRKIIAVVVCVGLLCSSAFGADDFTLLKEERIGSLYIGMSAAKIGKVINCPLKRGAEKWWGADGAYHQEWSSRACGVTLGMVSAKKGGSKSVESITIVAPSMLATKYGIRIGSAEPEVVNAYKRYRDADNSVAGETFVAGSIFGGLILGFEKGKVNRIFLGAAAE